MGWYIFVLQSLDIWFIRKVKDPQLCPLQLFTPVGLPSIPFLGRIIKIKVKGISKGLLIMITQENLHNST